MRTLPILLLALAAIPIGCASHPTREQPAMNLPSEHFGTVDGKEVRVYTLTNHHGMTAKITNYGATVTQFLMPDRDGHVDDIVLGFDTLDDYMAHTHYFGATAGRVANRIAAGRFTLDGKTYQLAVNNGPNHLHGGVKGFDKVVWTAEPLDHPGAQAIRFTYHSPDGEEGYPGNLDVTTDYILTDDNEFRVEMRAVTDAPTPVNLVHHSYWNLSGHDSGTILGHELMLNCNDYTPADSTYIPTGEIATVDNTPYDWRTPMPIGAVIDIVPRPNDEDPGGYDINLVVDGDPDRLRLAAVVMDDQSGRSMEIWANQPGIQFYTGNWLSDVHAKHDAVYDKHAALCLETQAFPDAVNHQGEPGWPNVILRPGDQYEHIMVYKFRAE